MVDKVRELLATGTIQEADRLRYDEKFRTMDLFSKVYGKGIEYVAPIEVFHLFGVGVGVSTAKIWWDSGYRTLQEVLDNEKLTPTAQLSIQLFPELNQP
jgi:hypothetical protein